MTIALTASAVFDGSAFLHDHSIIIDGENIAGVCPSSTVPEGLEHITLGEGVLAPGLIDLQVNGGGGTMLNNMPTRAGVDTMVAGHRATGTTAMMPTVISDTPEVQRAAVEAVREARASGNAGVLGIHIEGPFFDLEKRGTHKASMIRHPEVGDINWLCSLTDLKVILTLAPEHTLRGQIGQLSSAGVLVCAGHTNASYVQVAEAIAQGLCGFTHLFNAMRPLAAREPGTVGAALEFDQTFAGIIADGHHVDAATIRIAHRVKAPGKLLLVTDSMATVGSEKPFFEIYGERIEVSDGRLINSEGVLAGSAIGMIDAVRIATTEVGLPLEESLRMASLYPANFLGLEKQLGRLQPGYRADLVHFNDGFEVLGTWVAGQHQTHNSAARAH
jgi:N-acetylglucosamine-6-phosphate deacetylase